MTATLTDLLKKYDVPGPRYTSYPTILHWEESPTVEQWLTSVAKSLNQTDCDANGSAIYVHIPFCRSLCTYCACNSRITTNSHAGSAYVQTILREWQLYRELLGRDDPLPVTELHLGGGTPTYLTAAELDRMISGILAFTRQPPAAEFSLESDPRVTQPEQLSTLYRLGFKRLSLGVQDFDNTVQSAVNRIQSEAEVQSITETARAIGYTSINYDLIYGLPFQTPRSIEQTVKAVVRLRPNRIAFYSYAHVPWRKPGQRHFTEANLPSGDEKRGLYELGRTLLEDAGYREIGMDHFALDSDSLWQATVKRSLHRNFMGYTTRLVAPLIGLGVSAISDSWEIFAQNEKDLERYEARVAHGELPIQRGHILNPEDQILRRHILNLMTRLATDWRNSKSYTPFLETVGDRLEELVGDGLVMLCDRQAEVTVKGKPFLRNICMSFDARLARNNSATKLFSRTI